MVAGAWAYHEAGTRVYERAHDRYLKLDCKQALPELRKLTGAGRYRLAWVASTDRVKQLIEECEAIEQSNELAVNRGRGAVGQSYARFLEQFPDSEVHAAVRRRRAENFLAWGSETLAEAGSGSDLVESLRLMESALSDAGSSASFRNRIGREMRKVWVAAQAEGDRCQRADALIALSDAKSSFASARAQSISIDARRAAAQPILSCARSAYAASRYRDTIRYLNKLLEVPRPRSIAAGGRTLLIDAEVALVRGGRTGSLPSPHASGSTRSGNVVLSIRNDSPMELELLLSGPHSQRSVIPACNDCTEYAEPPAACNTGAPSRTITIVPGRYEVVARSPGGDVRPFAGSWQMESGYRYSHCFFIVYRSASNAFDFPFGRE